MNAVLGFMCKVGWYPVALVWWPSYSSYLEGPAKERVKWGFAVLSVRRISLFEPLNCH